MSLAFALQAQGSQYGGMMEELSDYSGPFLPQIDFNNFSKETLINLLKMYTKLYIAIDGFWYMTVMDRNGNEEALACDINAWKLMSKYEKKRIGETLGIQGDDILSFIKTLQISPWFIHTKYTVDVENNNDVVLTVNHCPTLEALEKEGIGRQKQICGIFEPEIFSNYVSLFNTKIEIRSLTPLPRNNREDVCCKWIFKLKP